jgi:hypothetical protein
MIMKILGARRTAGLHEANDGSGRMICIIAEGVDRFSRNLLLAASYKSNLRGILCIKYRALEPSSLVTGDVQTQCRRDLTLV